MNETSQAVTKTLACQECQRVWWDSRERWRLYLTDDEPVEAIAYCSVCASREFDPD